jgi:hypothetical protein
VRLRTIETAGFKRERRKALPWSDSSFCAEHKLDLREFGRWLAGGLPDSSTTTKSIERALFAEIRRMQQKKITPSISTALLNTP